jgi:hypothetical protein
MNMMCSRTTRLWVVAVFCAGIALGQTVKGVANIKVILGKQPGASSVILNPSPTGAITGQLPNKVPSGTSFVVLDQQGNIVSTAPVNAADGTFTLPPPRVPMQENFSACLRSPGAAPVCSDPGALKVLTPREVGSGMATGRSANLTPSAGTPVGQAAPLSAADAALLANVQIVKAPNGTWRCTSTGGRICSDTETKLFTSATKSRSNTKDNLTIAPSAPDGTFRCFRASDNKPCSDAEVQELAAQVKAVQQKAVQQKGVGGF